MSAESDKNVGRIGAFVISLVLFVITTIDAVKYHKFNMNRSDKDAYTVCCKETWLMCHIGGIIVEYMLAIFLFSVAFSD
jgi:hypothetical protein